MNFWYYNVVSRGLKNKELEEIGFDLGSLRKKRVLQQCVEGRGDNNNKRSQRNKGEVIHFGFVRFWQSVGRTNCYPNSKKRHLSLDIPS